MKDVDKGKLLEHHKQDVMSHLEFLEAVTPEELEERTTWVALVASFNEIADSFQEAVDSATGDGIQDAELIEKTSH